MACLFALLTFVSLAGKKNFHQPFHSKSRNDENEIRSRSFAGHGHAIEILRTKQSFFRIHRSYIISLDAVVFIEGHQVSVGGAKLSVSERLREMLVERLGKR